MATTWVSAPIGMASGSMTMSSIAMPYSVVATSTILATSSIRLSASIGISSASLGRQMIAASWRLTSGRISSIRSSSAVIELTSALPWYASRPASSASTTDESMQIGRSVRDCTSLIARGQQLGLVGQRHAHVDVEHVGAAGHLGGDVALDRGQVPGPQLLLEDLAAGRVDPFADDRERTVVAEHDLLGGGAQHGVQRVQSGIAVPRSGWSVRRRYQAGTGAARRLAISSLAFLTVAEASAA